MNTYRIRKISHGFGLPTAIFIILIMSLIALVVIRQSQSSAEVYSRNFISTKAILAAEAGIEVNLAELIRTGGSCLSSSPVSFNSLGLQGCEASFTCTSQSVETLTFTVVQSRGTCGQGIDAASREIRVKFWQ